MTPIVPQAQTPQAMTGEARIIRGNALDLPLADASVDLIVTSPPYFALRSYRDGGEHYDGQIGAEATPEQFVDALITATREMMRVLKPSGSIFVNLGDKYFGAQAQTTKARSTDDSSDTWRRTDPKRIGVPGKSLIGVPWRYAIRCIDELGLILRAEIVWAKPNGLPESVTDRVRRSHEQWFHFTKSPRYYSAVDEIREKYLSPESPTARRGPSGTNRGIAVGTTHDDGKAVGNFNHSPLGKLPGSVWTIASEPLKVDPALGIDHFAAFPTEWPRRIILGWSPPAICEVCGEGLRPVVEKEALGPTMFRPALAKGRAIGHVSSGPSASNVLHTITGYACACDTPGPLRPAVVLDPFSGTGTTAGVAKALGRIGIGVDMSADYCRLAEWRTNGAGYAVIERKVHERTYGTTKKKRAPKPTEPDEPTLFGDEAA